MMEELDDYVLQDLYTWIDEIPLSRPKRILNRDFSDGVLLAELVKHFLPKLVEIHNYPPANGTEQKLANWNMISRKVLRKINMELSEDVIRSIVRCQPWTIERVLLLLRTKIDRALYEKQRKKDGGPFSERGSDRPEADQSPRLSRRSPAKMKQSPSRELPPPQHININIPPGMEISKRQAKDYTSDNIPRIAYEEKEQECLAKEETIQILQAKVRRLEHLLHLKDVRIDELQKNLEHARPTGMKR